MDITDIEQKARKAFEIRNKAKDFAREMSGPELKKEAEEISLARYGSIEGETFDELFKKNYDKAIKDGLTEACAKIKAYEGIVESSKRANLEINKQNEIN